MPAKTDWKSLSHRKRVGVLASSSDDDIAERYESVGEPADEFKRLLAQERALWIPKNLGEFKTAGKPPTKDSLLGAWRDLERSEALLELIDNSIDVWLDRRAKHPKATAKDLNILITIDDKLGLLRYEDNAGGVPENKLEHLVVPGYSDTTDLSQTIGSYKTGGKKAIFRLATAAQILTRYWDPEGKTDSALSVHLDEHWLSDPDLYKFDYALLQRKMRSKRVIRNMFFGYTKNPWRNAVVSATRSRCRNQKPNSRHITKLVAKIIMTPDVMDTEGAPPSAFLKVGLVTWNNATLNDEALFQIWPFVFTYL